MNDLKEEVSTPVEIILQWIYANRKKPRKIRYVILISLFIIGVLSISFLVYYAGCFFLINHEGTEKYIFCRILIVVVSFALVILAQNWGEKQIEFSEVFLGYYYLVHKHKKEKNSIIKNVVLISGTIVGTNQLIKVIDVISDIRKINMFQSTVFGFEIISLFIYLPLTEFIIDEIKKYRIKANSSLVLFCILFWLYVFGGNNDEIANSENMTNIVIFAVGQIAFVESAIINKKNLYIKLKEEEKDELKKYLQNVDDGYKKVETKFRIYVNVLKDMAKSFWGFFCSLNLKRKIVVVILLILITGMYFLWAWWRPIVVLRGLIK